MSDLTPPYESGDDTDDASEMVVVHDEAYDGEHVTGEGSENCPCGPTVASPDGDGPDLESSLNEQQNDAGTTPDVSEDEPEEKGTVDPTETAPSTETAIGRSESQEQSVAGANRAHYQGVIDRAESEYRRAIAETVERHPIFAIRQQDADAAVTDLDETRQRAQEAYDRTLEESGVRDLDDPGLQFPEHSDRDGLPTWADGVGDDDLAPDADLDDDEMVAVPEDGPARQEFPPGS